MILAPANYSFFSFLAYDFFYFELNRCLSLFGSSTKNLNDSYFLTTRDQWCKFSVCVYYVSELCTFYLPHISVGCAPHACQKIKHVMLCYKKTIFCLWTELRFWPLCMSFNFDLNFLHRLQIWMIQTISCILNNFIVNSYEGVIDIKICNYID